MNKKTLVLGATGKTGKRVIEKLKNLGHPVRLGSRSAEIPFDWQKPETWSKILRDIGIVYVSFHPDVALPEAPKSIKLFVDHAKEAGVEKLVLLSGRGEVEAQNCENHIIESGLDWTIIRASWFMQNFNEGIWRDAIITGHLVLPKVKALEPFVDVDDIAEVAVAALTSKIHSKKVYELTGPELLSFKKTTEHISKAIGKQIIFQEVSIGEYGAILREYQTPEDIIGLIQYLFAEVLDGRNEVVTNDIEGVLGRKATPFKVFAANAALTGVWSKRVTSSL